MFIRHSAQPDLIRDDVMRSMFAARKAVFVDLLQWDLPVHDGRYEIDQFDDPHARYIILSQEDGNHLGSARLLPTSRPHILGSLYPQLCAEAPPSGPDIFEITRFCLDRRLRAPERRRVRDALILSLTEHALASGITTYVAIAAQSWARQIEAFGWDCAPLGPPRQTDDASLVALRIAITPRTPALLEAAGLVSPALPGERVLAA